jgi:hypothetical protein
VRQSDAELAAIVRAALADYLGTPSWNELHSLVTCEFGRAGRVLGPGRVLMELRFRVKGKAETDAEFEARMGWPSEPEREFP